MLDDLATRRGFSLLETLIAVVVLGVLVSIAFVPGARYFRQVSVNGATSRFVGAHALARSTALRFPGGAELRIDASADRYWVVVDSSAAAGLDTISTVRDTAGQIDLTSDAAVLCFDVRGLPWTGESLDGGTCDGPSATVVMSVAGVADTVSISSLGRVLP